MADARYGVQSVVLIHNHIAHCYWVGDSPIFVSRKMGSHFLTGEVIIPDSIGGALLDCFGSYSAFKLKYTATRLEVGDIIIQLADIHPVGIDEQCETAAGTYWPCGKFARTEMRQFIRGRPIECDRREVSTQPVRTRCRLASFDISAWLVLTGWAEPAGDLFADELSEAKAGERGIWRKAAP